MRRKLSIQASLILLLLLAALPPLALAEAAVDIITIKDGSVLRGEIKRVENDELILDTDYADDVVIDVEHIVDIKSKEHFSVRLITGEIISGFLAVSDGKIVLRETPSPPGALVGPEAPEEIVLAEPTSQVPPTTPDLKVDEVAKPTSQTAESQLQQTTPNDLQQAKGAVEIAEPADDWSAESRSGVERPGGRQFTFDDVDWIREKPTYFRYDSELNVAAQLARGNTDTTDLHFDARFEPSFGWNTLRITGQFDKKTADGSTTTNRWKAGLVYERDFRRRWYVGAANTYESDAQKNMDLRVIIAAGVGYRFFDQDPTHFSVLPALAYVNENFEAGTDDTNYAAIQLGMDFTRDLYKDDITFFHKNTYLNNLQELSDINIETRTGIKFDMAWDLVLSAEVETDWENEPAEDAKKLDTRYMLKIGFEFEGDEDDWFH